MTTFTIDAENSISAFRTHDEAESAISAGAQPFASREELDKLAAAWPPERLPAIWNSLPGVKPVKEFKSAQAAAGRIWGRIQTLGGPDQPKAERKAKRGAQGANSAPAKPKASNKAKPAKKAPKPPHKAKAAEAK